MNKLPDHEAPPKEVLSPLTKATLQLASVLLPALTAIAGGLWVAFTYLEQQSKAADQEAGRSLLDSKARLLEAQKSFLDKKTQLYFRAAEIAGKLSNENVDKADWADLNDQFWALRWSEIEMVGSPLIRERMRAVGEGLNRFNEMKKNNMRDDGQVHYLRWMIECLADELRASMDQSWRGELAYQPSELPVGCYSSGDHAVTPPFVPDVK